MTPFAYRADAMRHLEALGAQWQNITTDFSAFLMAPAEVQKEEFGVTYADLRVSTHPIHNETTYLTAMHEAGHIASGHMAKYHRCRHKLNNSVGVRWEAEAWAWAFDNSSFPISDDGVYQAVYSLNTYIADPYGRMRWQEEDLIALPSIIHTHPRLRRERSAA